MSVSQTIADFTAFLLKEGPWQEIDKIYVENRLMALVGVDEIEEVMPSAPAPDVLDLLDELIKIAVKAKKIENISYEKDILAAQIMDLVTPAPSSLQTSFMEKYQMSPKDATDYFYQLCRLNNDVQTRQIAKNIMFPTETEFGELEITINLSKPEKDPKEIALAKFASDSQYPKCLLCIENEGYLGRVNHPARSNHRVVRLDLLDKKWGLQYSPYAYYAEHCILLSAKHEPMQISQQTFANLLAFVEKFPHYFMGSNADLPIVGGSILAHEHYQGGGHDFPMAKAPMIAKFSLVDFPEVTAGIVEWPMSVIRLRSEKIDELVQAAEMIRLKWRDYQDETVEIVAYDADGTPHHTITPIARFADGKYELDIVLRDNHVSVIYPDGVFHPHQDVQHIKKENIGLIEVMGLAVLPARLKAELQEVGKYVLNQTNEIADYHKNWADDMKGKYNFTTENVTEIVQQ